MALIDVVGFDPSMRHWGVAQGTYDTVTKAVTISNIFTSDSNPPKGKQIRQNSKDLEVARTHTITLVDSCRDANAIFVEVPHGSQSARAMCSYGMCVGILGAMRGGGINFYEVSAMEVKRIVSSASKVTKKEMIAWAMDKHPNANWPYYKKNGETLLSQAKAEHMADAIIAIYAGINSPQFLQATQLIK